MMLVWISLAVYSFGAMAFTALAWSYWWQGEGKSRVFRVFTLACALAFLSSLAANLFPVAAITVEQIRNVLLAFLPAIMFHLVCEREQLVRPLQFLALGLNYNLALWSLVLPIPERIEDALPDMRLALAAIGAIAVLIGTRRWRSVPEQRHRLWDMALFVLMLWAAVLDTQSDNLLLDLAPDYLLLAFFAVWLYYRERLTFFDVFLKGGAYFLAGGLQLAILLSILPAQWAALGVGLTFWLVGPFLWGEVSRLVDRQVLGRLHSHIEAERLFMQAIQTATGRNDLRAKAAQSLSTIFRARATVEFANRVHADEPGSLAAALHPEGRIHLAGRDNQIPYLSQDLQLLDTLAATLEVVLRQQDLAEHAAQAELRALRAQINPHFLFNALNAIAGWIRVRPDVADDTVAQLAEVFRYALNRSDQEWVQLSDEIDFIRAYLAVEQARFGDRLRVSIEGDVPPLMIPAMIVQPLVENAIKHGTSQVSGTGEVRVHVRSERERVWIEVADNGPGFPPGFAIDHAGYGLRNVASRLHGYYGERSVLRWENNRVTIGVPLP